MIARLASLFCACILMLGNISPVGLDGGKPEAPDVTITVWHAYNAPETAALEDVIAGFQAVSPTIQVEPQYYPFNDLRNIYISATLAGSGPALLLGPADWGTVLAKDGLIQDVSGMVSADVLNSVLPGVLETAQYRGGLLGLPHSSKGVALFRNTSIITHTVGAYAELVTVAQAATHGEITGAHLERGFFFGAGHLYGLGGRLMDLYGCPAFNTAEGEAWLELLDSFDQAGPAEYYTDADIDAFKAGKVGFVIDGTWNLGSFRDALGDANLAIDPWPAPLSGYVQSELVYLSSAAVGEIQEAGLAFMAYLLSQDAQEAMLAGGHLPAVSGVAITDPLLQQALIAFTGGVSFPALPQLDAYWLHMDTALQAVFDLSADPSLALQQAHNRITSDLEGMGYYCAGRVFLPALVGGVLPGR